MSLTRCIGMSMPRPHGSELCRRLTIARELAGLSAEEVSASLGLDSCTAIESWESADRVSRAVPSAHHVLKLAKLYDLPAYLLVDDAVLIADIESYKGKPIVKGYETDSFRR